MCTEYGDVAIDDLAICKEAAAELNYEFQKTANAENWPKGCFEYDNAVHFNEHVHGSKNSALQQLSRQICKKGDN